LGHIDVSDPAYARDGRMLLGGTRLRERHRHIRTIEASGFAWQ
jgi:hypothetical protein